MKTAKRLISLILAVLILTAFVSCNVNNNKPEATTESGSLSTAPEVTTESGSLSTTPEVTTESGNLSTVPEGLTFLTQRSNAKRLVAEAVKDDSIESAADFSLKLLNACSKAGENEFISPLSVMLALSMTANGADSDTLSAMESTLGLSISDLNSFLNSFIQSLKNTDNASLVSANSVWVSNDRGFTVRDAFVDTVKSYYDAEIVSAPFSDPGTLPALNNWVKENTDGMIDKILDELSRDAIMVLLNALTFDAEWQEKFEREASDGTFKNSDGTVSTAKFMYGYADKYISGNGCTGFVKNYKDGNYSYVALLPNTDSTANELAASLTGEKFIGLFNGAKAMSVNITLPKYSLDYEITLNDTLKAMGMGVAFNPDFADFSLIGTLDDPDSNIYISKVIHKTHLEVDESGTRAAAVTAVVMEKATAMLDTKYVYLDRPFVYAIVDNATGIPVFIGIADNMK